MYNPNLHRRKKYFCCYFLQAFSTEEILKHIADCFKINVKQNVIMPVRSEYVKLKNYERKIQSAFIIYADFESILVPEDNGKQNQEELYTNKYQKYVACTYGYKLVFVDDKFSQPFKTCLGEDAIYNFINNMIKESKYCSEVIEKHFNKGLIITKEDNKDF